VRGAKAANLSFLLVEFAKKHVIGDRANENSKSDSSKKAFSSEVKLNLSQNKLINIFSFFVDRASLKSYTVANKKRKVEQLKLFLCTKKSDFRGNQQFTSRRKYFFHQV